MPDAVSRFGRLRAAVPALFAALLFGASTPFAKLLVGDMSPVLLAGILYLGSGLGLGVLVTFRWLRHRNDPVPMTVGIPRADWSWLLSAIGFGGVCGPVLLMLGLSQTSAASAALLLNLEGVFTALIAWVVFKEHADRNLVTGMVLIVLAGVLLSSAPGSVGFSSGALLVVGACACWAIDNNLTRKVATNDAMVVACAKGLVAGTVNTAIALVAGSAASTATSISQGMIVGFLGYGLSLTLFVVALRTLGTARSGAYFSVAPFFGVVISFILWPAMPSGMFWVAAALTAIGVWLHVRERHEHEHLHRLLEHGHPHRHDEHHRHPHEFEWDGQEPHVHVHRHEPINHRHIHYPDIHHRHSH